MNILKKGFTLIELIIVIAILGILAAGLLAILDPIEQINRATDTKYLTSAGEIKNSVERYYASKQYYPWCTSAGCATYRAPCTAARSRTAFATGGTCAAAVLTELINTGELKTGTTVNSVINLEVEAGGDPYQLSWVPASKNVKTQYAAVVGNSGVYVAPIATDACATIGTAALCPNTSATCTYCLFK
ncbi:hypothetical protein A3C28_01055 [Candidatus Roizmanbacteria bacterium RIFCSPHIGHO2_02_FULL_39_9]|uniref:Type II secretion system protein GspG C-terminal domain-containing protein n=1 Tax=Candidatus Roizmanbacteria bacterium RIFCSPHIGHO2_02_FULL_39_9 TaxID=1802040 RepID=A0A1F7H7J0_9BACT|nr:MAG: hypothetical protein A3C28_01055 [Candidatus Roizmanbacteria bacterium RIFCSPHIGHO2_02_FULL_39_9]